MLLNVYRRLPGSIRPNRVFNFFEIDTSLLLIILLNCFCTLFGLYYSTYYHKELINTKCYFRIYSPVIFYFQFIPTFLMLNNDSPKAAFTALMLEIIGTIALIGGNLVICSTDWKYEALVIYLPRIFSIYVYLKALMFYTLLQQHQQQLRALNDTDTDSSSDDTVTTNSSSDSSSTNDDDETYEEFTVVSQY